MIVVMYQNNRQRVIIMYYVTYSTQNGTYSQVPKVFYYFKGVPREYDAISRRDSTKWI